MQINTRLSGELAVLVGRPRLTVTLPAEATVADLMERLRQAYPEATQRLNTAVPVVAGRHVSPDAPLSDGQEVAFLLPIAGG